MSAHNTHTHTCKHFDDVFGRIDECIFFLHVCYAIRLVSLSYDWFKLQDKYKSKIQFVFCIDALNSPPKLTENWKCLSVFLLVSLAFTFVVYCLAFSSKKVPTMFVCVRAKKRLCLALWKGDTVLLIRNLFDFLLVDVNESHGSEKENERTS